MDGEEDAAAAARLRKAETIGRPIGSESFLAALEAKTRRPLQTLQRGPKPTADRAEVTER